MRLTASALMIIALVLVSQTAPVSAHAEIVSSTPTAGSAVDVAPASVTAGFSQKLAPDESSLTVLDAQGARVDLDDSAVDPSDSEGKTMSVSLKANLPAGTYTVEWKTLSAEDGEATDGQFQFTVRTGASPAASASAAAQPSASAAARPSPAASAGASASAAAVASAGASPAASPAGGAQPGALPETGATERPLGLVAAFAGVLLALGLLLRRGLRR
jgi:methionine-rich copper-binding protein CopC